MTLGAPKINCLMHHNNTSFCGPCSCRGSVIEYLVQRVMLGIAPGVAGSFLKTGKVLISKFICCLELPINYTLL